MSDTLKLAHLSDLHLAAPLQAGQWTPKRLLARMNWQLSRKRRHLPDLLSRAVKKIIDEAPDVVLLTGDCTQTGTPQELQEAASRLDPLLQHNIPTLIVDGNHDWYGGSLVHGFHAFCETFAQHIPVTPAGLATVGEVQVLLLRQGCATPPFCAYGKSNPQQLQELAADCDSTSPRLRLAMGHYPLRYSAGRHIPPSHRIWGGSDLATFLEAQNVTSYFCGHIHHPFVLTGHYGFSQHCSGSSTTDLPVAFFRY